MVDQLYLYWLKVFTDCSLIGYRVDQAAFIAYAEVDLYHISEEA